jgi:hypothetical protein
MIAIHCHSDHRRNLITTAYEQHGNLTAISGIHFPLLCLAAFWYMKSNFFKELIISNGDGEELDYFQYLRLNEPYVFRGL